MSDLQVLEVGPEHAGDVLDVIHAAFGARQRLDPPSTAVQESVDSVARALDEEGGLLVLVDGLPAGALLFRARHTSLVLRRVSVHPRFQQRGVASAMVGVAEEVADRRGADVVRLAARAELPGTRRFWERRGYLVAAESGVHIEYAKTLPFEVMTPSASDTRRLGRQLAQSLTAGDVVLLTGELGAGKTTLAQGVGEGLGVRGEITSPTFVIARIHPSLGGGPVLVHVDAYRLGGAAELDDLDLDTSLSDAVTVVEWGGGLAEGLSEDRLEVSISRSPGHSGADHDELRTVRIVPVGLRWVGAALRPMLRPGPATTSGAAGRSR
jgi:tRNA threonylcarbamoyladenosine biosynthesis protein TsaE